RTSVSVSLLTRHYSPYLGPFYCPFVFFSGLTNHATAGRSAVIGRGRSSHPDPRPTPSVSQVLKVCLPQDQLCASATIPSVCICHKTSCVCLPQDQLCASATRPAVCICHKTSCVHLPQDQLCVSATRPVVCICHKTTCAHLSQDQLCTSTTRPAVCVCHKTSCVHLPQDQLCVSIDNINTCQMTTRNKSHATTFYRQMNFNKHQTTAIYKKKYFSISKNSILKTRTAF
ncbi:hypothetical protein OTU49_004498, partial [Cherax quadricarinatus]